MTSPNRPTSTDTKYDVTVRAVNAAGAGEIGRATGRTETIPPSTDPPWQPQTVSGAAGNHTATIRWSPPNDTNGGVINRYQVHRYKANKFLAAGARSATFGGLSNAKTRQVTIPLLVLLQWDDEGNDRQMALDLFDAFGSKEKKLHANMGGHTGLPQFEADDGTRFFDRHLSRCGQTSRATGDTAPFTPCGRSPSGGAAPGQVQPSHRVDSSMPYLAAAEQQPNSGTCTPRSRSRPT